MNKNTVCRLCRKSGKKLFLKGERCNGAKCSIVRRNYPPGIRGINKPNRLSEYANQLKEKQSAKAIYRLREKQFKNYFIKSAKCKANTGEKLLQLLESRLDNVVYRLGFTSSRKSARQIISHGKIKVNDKSIDIPSYNVRQNDKITTTNENLEISKNLELPVWLHLEKNKMQGTVIKIPSRNEIETDINEQIIIEFYSR